MPDLWFHGILDFFKCPCYSSKFHKIGAIILKLHTNITYRSRTFDIEFSQNRFTRLNFCNLEFFESQNFSIQANFELSSWNLVRECTNTEWCLILNLVRTVRGLSIVDEFFNCFHRDIKFWKFHVSSRRKPKLSNILPQRKNFLKLVRNQYGNPNLHALK